MAIFVSLVCLFFIMIITFFDKRIYNPFILFNAWWGITIYLSSLGLFNIYVPTNDTYLIMLIAILSFNFSLVFLLRNKSKLSSLRGNSIQIKDSNAIFNKFLLITHLIIIIILFFRTLKTLELLLSGVSYSVIRYNYFKLETIMTGYDHLINNIFVTPVLTFSIIFVSLQYFNKRMNKTILFTTLLSISLYVFSSGGRSIIITLGISFFAAYIINRKNKNNIKLSKKIFTQFLLVVVLFSLIFVSLGRMETEGGLNEVANTVFRYFTASYIYYEKMIPLVKEDNVYLYGSAFFGGLIDIFIFILRFIGIEINPTSSYISTHNQVYITVSNDGAIYNAFPTMLYTFYYDFGYLGIILGPLLFGLSSLAIYKKMISSNSFGFTGIYIMVILTIYESTLRWTGSFANLWVVVFLFLVIHLITNRRVINKL
jgi:oligosaccharide repeat unit polymerase